jgi:hypothetical protein
MKGDVIAVLDVSRLIRMGVLSNHMIALAHSLGVQLRTKSHRDGLHFANPNYWVAYRWIPAECIERYILISAMRKIYKYKGIGMWTESRLVWQVGAWKLLFRLSACHPTMEQFKKS